MPSSFAVTAARPWQHRRVRPLELSPDGIADVVEETLAGDVGGWSMGVQGALAEFAVVAGERPEVRRSGRTVEAVTGGGGIRVTITDAPVAHPAGPEAGPGPRIAHPPPARA